MEVISGSYTYSPAFGSNKPVKKTGSGEKPSIPTHNSLGSSLFKKVFVPFLALYALFSGAGAVGNYLPTMRPTPDVPEDGYMPNDFATFSYYGPDKNNQAVEVPVDTHFADTKAQTVYDLNTLLRHRPDVLAMLREQDLHIRLIHAQSIATEAHPGREGAGGSRDGGMDFATLAVPASSAVPNDGFHVVFHEGAHHIDRLGGPEDKVIYGHQNVDGFFPGMSEAQKQEFADLREKEFRKIAQGKSVIGDYVLTYKPGLLRNLEFLSELTVAYLEKPVELKTSSPELFEFPRSFFHYDTVTQQPYNGKDAMPSIWRRPGDRERREQAEMYVFQSTVVIIFGTLILVLDERSRQGKPALPDIRPPEVWQRLEKKPQVKKLLDNLPRILEQTTKLRSKARSASPRDDNNQPDQSPPSESQPD